MKTVFALLFLLNLTATLASEKSQKQEEQNPSPNQHLETHPQNVDDGKIKKPENVMENPHKKEVKDIVKALEVNSGNIPQAKTNINNPNIKHDTSSKTLPNSKKDLSNETVKNQTQIESKNVPWSNDVQHESSILTKGMMLLLTISLLFMMFVAYKTYRRKSRYARIKKYGVRLTRGNIEMRPLPLDNDDEDETIFDLKNVPT